MVKIDQARNLRTAAHSEALQGSAYEISVELERVLGHNLVAVIVGKDPRTVTRWVRKDTTPSTTDERKLRDTYQVYRLLSAVEGDHTIRAWFMGMNPQLDDEAPAEAIAEGNFKAVMSAARAFVTGG